MPICEPMSTCWVDFDLKISSTWESVFYLTIDFELRIGVDLTVDFDLRVGIDWKVNFDWTVGFDLGVGRTWESCGLESRLDRFNLRVDFDFSLGLNVNAELEPGLNV